MDEKKMISYYPLNEDAPAGHPKKAPKKVAGKSTDEVKKLVADIVAGRMGAFEIDLGLIKDPKDRCDVMLKLMQFVLPKVSAVDVNGALELDSVSEELSRLAGQTTVKAALGKGGKDISS